MNGSQPERGRSRRIGRIATPFAVGAVAGAGLLAWLGGTSPSTPSASVAPPVASAVATTVAQTSAEFSSETIYELDSPGVVDITVTEAASQGGGGGLSPFVPGGGSRQATAEGTGYVYDGSGDIITADHVVSGARKITVRFRDGTIATAKLVGTDPSTDTAVIKVSVPSSQLTPLALADSAAVRPGEGVVAIGSPFGYSESITAGIVSAVDRSIEAPNGFTIPNTIQTDAPINHGNSGGPLIDASGKVVGTNVQIATDSQSSTSDNAGVGFAVPSNTVKSVADALIAGKTVEHAYLGVSIGDNQTGSGAKIGAVRPGSPAKAAGLEAGDVVTAVDGVKVTDANDLTAAITGHQPGDTIHLNVTRGGSTLDVTAKLATRPATNTA